MKLLYAINRALVKLGTLQTDGGNRHHLDHVAVADKRMQRLKRRVYKNREPDFECAGLSPQIERGVRFHIGAKTLDVCYHALRAGVRKSDADLTRILDHEVHLDIHS